MINVLKPILADLWSHKALLSLIALVVLPLQVISNETTESLLVRSFVVISFLLLLSHIVKSRTAFVCILIPLFIASSFDIGHYLVFGDGLTTHAALAILIANFNESVEFVSGPESGQMILFWAAVSLILFCGLGWQVQRRICLNKKTLSLLFFLVGSIVVASGLILGPHLTLKKLITEARPYRSVESLIKGGLLLSSYHELAKNEAPLSKLKFSEDPETHVLVIGESVRRKSLRYYGAVRDTNPHTAQYLKNMLIMNDVISEASSTVPSLYLSLFPTQNEKVSLIELAQAKGFEVQWLSNQRTSGYLGRPLHWIADQADRSVYLPIGTSKDGQLIQKFDEALKSQKSKRLIVLHLIGSHFAYDNRYPLEFDRFKDCDPQTTKAQCYKMNTYDNSLVYTDFVIAEIVEKLSMLEVPSSLTYFADHGEILSTDGFHPGHGGPTTTKEEVDVPAWFWISEGLKKKDSQLFNELSPLAPEPLTLSDFSCLALSLWSTKNFSECLELVRRPRVIIDPNRKPRLYRSLPH